MAHIGGAAAKTSPAISQQSLQSANQQHKRVYQACIPCRRRKVRCDLGSVDNPNDPPCVRCRRESKECFFSATRRKRKTDDDEGSDVDEYIVRNGRKRAAPHEETPPQIDRRLYSEVPLTPGGSHGRTQPLRRPGETGDGNSFNGKRPRTDSDFTQDGDDNQQMENPDAQTMMRRGVYGPHDALDLLYKAATDTDRLVQPTPRMDHHLANDNNINSPMNVGPKRDETRASVVSAQPSISLIDSTLGRVHSRHQSTPGRLDQPIDPELGKQDLSAQPGYAEAIKAWTRFRFVRAGWFTPQEAIEYID